jgi:hypothetical protein
VRPIAVASAEPRHAAPRRSVGLRALVVALCAMVAVPVVGSGMDRVAASDPGQARRVIPGFVAASLAPRGAGLVDARRYDEALPLAESAVRKSPVDPTSTALLGATRLGRGDAAGAERAFLVAGQFGWREPITQYYWMQRALQVGDYRVASLRLDAMLRQTPELAEEAGLIAPVQANPDGREALAERMAQRPAWLQPFADQTGSLSADQVEQRADVIDRLARKGITLGCDGVGRLASSLVNVGRPLRGKALWDGQCAEGRGLIGDPAFARLQAGTAASPFDWTIVGDSDVSISLVKAGGGDMQLQVASTASFSRKVMTQLLVLAPGRYRLSWTAASSEPVSGPAIQATLACQPDTRDVLPATRIGNDRYVADFQVDGACAARWLGFLIQPKSPALQLGRIALQRTG